MSTNEVLCTRRDFERARSAILDYLQKSGYTTRRTLSNFRVWGLPYEAIELALRDLLAKGTVEELYVLPGTRRNGVRPEHYGLSVALDAKAVELPEGVVRESEAFGLIADLEAVS